MMTRLRCAAGHEWVPAEATAAPLVCPTCGRPPLTHEAAGRESDQAPCGAGNAGVPLPASEVTQTMHFTPPPITPLPVGIELPSGKATGAGNHSETRGTAAPGAAAAMPFAIIRQHARGGLGVVSLARDVHINREVALKQILPQHVENAALNRRFLYEAQITGQLEHPSIVPVYCLGQDEAEHPYYVMRFVKGRTLDEIIKEHHASPNPIVFRELLRRFIAVCQALAYAHSRGVIHRDLKPANVMLGDYGETLVLDWGLAKDIKQGSEMSDIGKGYGSPGDVAGMKRGGETGGSGKEKWSPEGVPGGAGGAPKAAPGMKKGNEKEAPGGEMTSEGQIIGTPAYMAPEQAEGRTELHGPVTDIYALGGILYKILTGQSPQAPTASGTGSSGQRRFTFAPSPPPSKIAKDVDPILERICLRAMATDPAARYPRVLEMVEEIQRWLDEHPLTFKAATFNDKVVNVLKPVLIPLLAGLVLLIVGLVMVMLKYPGK
jgi:eukaryotic-like serine/threonine-protein kinase